MDLMRSSSRLYLLRTERAQIALQVPSGHQLHDDQCGLALRNHPQEAHLHQDHTRQKWLSVCVFVCARAHEYTPHGDS